MNEEEHEEKEEKRRSLKQKWNLGKQCRLPNMVHKTILNRAIVAHRDHRS